MRYLITFSMFGLLMAGTATAQDDPRLFEDIDSNHNGEISMDEAKEYQDLNNDFNKIDKNSDGWISVDEYTVYENRGKIVPEEVEVPEPGAAPMPSY